MSIIIADLLKMEKLNIPKTILKNQYEDLIGQILFIYPYEMEAKQVPSSDEEGNTHTKTLEVNQTKLGRLLSIKDGVCKFQRKNGSTFRIDSRDIKSMELFLSKNYRAN